MNAFHVTLSVIEYCFRNGTQWKLFLSICHWEYLSLTCEMTMLYSIHTVESDANLTVDSAGSTCWKERKQNNL